MDETFLRHHYMVPVASIEFATVDEVIAILQKASADGHGHKPLMCNGEYYVAKPTDTAKVFDSRVDLGGYA